MKIKNYKILTIAILIAGIAFTSCRTSKNDIFSQKKYTHFHKDNGVAKINPVIEKNSLFSQKSYKTEAPILQEVVRKNKEITISSNESANFVANNVQKPIIYLNTKKINLSSSQIKQGTVKRNIRAAKEWFKSSGNTTYSQNDDVELLLLIILCFILPPLAVYLVRGMGSAFILSLILTLCFWLPGIIFALIVVLAD